VGDEGVPADPIRGALAEMRADLDGLIGREIARLRAARPSAIEVPLAAESRPPAAWSRRVGPTDPGDADAGSRLDALARRLEGRLRPPRARAADRDIPEAGRS